MRDDYLFIKQDLGALIRAQEAALLKEIDAFPSEKILSTNIDDICSYFYDKYLLPAPILNESEINTEQLDTEVDVSQDPNRVFLDPSGPYYIKGTRFNFYVPFSGDKDLFFYQPSTYTLNPPQGVVEDNELLLTYTRTNEPPEAIQASFQRDLASIKSYLGTVAKDVEAFNNGLNGLVRSRIDSRKKKLIGDQEIVAGFGYKERKKVNSELPQKTPILKLVKKTSSTVQAKKIKKRLEDDNLWVQHTVDGEDQHLYIGNKGDQGRKAHIIIDGITGEIRIEDNQKQPEEIVRQIKTILTLPDGREIHTTRELMEWKEQDLLGAQGTMPPIIEVATDSAVNDFGNQGSVNIHIINRTPYPLIIVSCQFDGVETNHGSKKINERDVFHFEHFEKDHVKDGYKPEFRLEIKTQTGAKFLFISRLEIKEFSGRFDLQIPGDEEIKALK